ncbi:sodium/potassium-transporting ATPase subunit beta-1-like [Parasteatoda tepidariorum]|uniref:sodium/potassium-transporting ATPase subunit beta-1-like n=1 Tax=Parasteatoda tepidariorum TaxID=114398 RepID=UPI00077FBEBE|nr:sodium/potassium-transporting ATPase subunit beta-1-like [Parasteatoda tepidariorum]
MNTDIEKQAVKDNLEKDGKVTDSDDSDLKKDPDAEEAAEDSPLKGNEANMDGKEVDPTGSIGEKSGAKEGAKGLREWLSKSRVKWWIAILVAIILLTIVLVGTLLAVEDDDFDIPDNSVRLVKLWPQPNKPRNIINFVHGTLPFEGRVWPDLTKQLDDLLIRYQPNINRSRNVVECYGGPSLNHFGTVCKFDIKPLMLECTKTMNYGYDQGRPCVFLEFSNITDWTPEPYSSRELENFVELSDRSVSNMVFLDCQGDTIVDKENMGKIQYTPDRGFPTKYFPYRGQGNYMSPIVGIRFNKPAIGVVISVTCRFYAKNLNHTDEAVPSGQISFNLLVD